MRITLKAWKKEDVSRNSIKVDGWVLEPVSDFNEIRSVSFTCGDEEIDDFFINDSERHLRDRMAVTYKMYSSEDPLRSIVALASLQNDAVKLKRGHRF